MRNFFTKGYLRWGLLIFLFASLIAFLNVGIIVTDELANRDAVPLIYPLVNELNGVYLAFLLIPFLTWFFKRYPLQRKNFWHRIFLYLLVSILFGAAHTTLMYVTRTVLYDLLNMGDYSKHYGLLQYRYLMEYQKQFIIFWLIYGVTFVVETVRENQRQKLQAAELAQQLAKARLQALQMQLNPHFLFNTLNMISSTLYENVKAADKMIANLSDLLRISLHSANREEHPLEKELEIAKLYLEIMKARFAEKLAVAWEIDEETLPALVPGFILQPLLENAILHGLETLEKVEITVVSKKHHDTLLLSVKDNGPGLPVNGAKFMGNGVGLSNTTERLEKLYGSRQRFYLQNREKGGLEAAMEIPFRQRLEKE